MSCCVRATAFYAACQRHMMVQYCCGTRAGITPTNTVVFLTIIIIMVIYKCYFSGELIALT